MHAEDLGVVMDGQVPDVILVGIQGTQLGDLVDATVGHAEFICQHFLPEEVSEDGHHCPAVPGVCDTAAVHNLPDHVLQRLPRDLWLLIKEHEQPLEGHRQVDIPKVILDVPAKRAKLLALRDDGVEEAGPKQQLVVGIFLGALRECLFAVEHVNRLDVVVAAQEIRTDARGVLVGDFDGVLEDGDGKEVRGHRRQPQTEVLAHGGEVGAEVGDDLLQLRHERLAQVAVLQQDPIASLLARVQGPLCRFALALPQGNHVHAVPEALASGKIHEEGEGISAGREDEDDGGGAVGVLGGALDAERRRVNEVGPQVPLHKLGGRKHKVGEPGDLDERGALHLRHIGPF
mmetsp:Transcript_46775/g.83841  ORF Transcript_46775/g.83841 Transcript_46775/m.83841 type:complete len:345 (+) Transcript_46775:834-1868(+)